MSPRNISFSSDGYSPDGNERTSVGVSFALKSLLRFLISSLSTSEIIQKSAVGILLSAKIVYNKDYVKDNFKDKKI